MVMCTRDGDGQLLGPVLLPAPLGRQSSGRTFKRGREKREKRSVWRYSPSCSGPLTEKCRAEAQDTLAAAVFSSGLFLQFLVCTAQCCCGACDWRLAIAAFPCCAKHRHRPGQGPWSAGEVSCHLLTAASHRGKQQRSQAKAKHDHFQLCSQSNPPILNHQTKRPPQLDMNGMESSQWTNNANGQFVRQRISHGLTLFVVVMGT